MFRAVVASLGRHTSSQFSCTWARRIYCRQQVRKLYQTTRLLSEKHDDKAGAATAAWKEEQQKSEDLNEQQYGTKPLTEEYPDERWQESLDEADTFGTIKDSPEFQNGKHIHREKRRNSNHHPSLNKKGKASYASNTPGRDDRQWQSGERVRTSRFPDKFDTSKSSDRSWNRHDYDDSNGHKPWYERKGNNRFGRESGVAGKYNKYRGHDTASESASRTRGFARQKQETTPDQGDIFGLLSNEGDEVRADLKHSDIHEGELLEEGLAERPHIPLGKYNRKHAANWYARHIMKLGKQGKVREAIEVFDRWMLQEDRVRPTEFEFGVLIQELGRVGYTRKAFKLYNQMVRMGIKDIYSPQIFTSLFNACANSPWPEDGLDRARKLRTRMLVKGIQPNFIVYQAMIKAFGMCGDINTAFSLADEAAHFYKPNNNLLSSLLVACITDKESGFRHAILVWRKMRKMGLEPELRDYCLLLRAVNECGIGDPEQAKDLLTAEAAPVAELESGIEAERTAGKTNVDVRKFELQNGKKKKKMDIIFNDIDTILAKYIEDDSEIGAVNEEDLEESEGEAHNVVSLKKVPENLEWWQMDVFHKDSEEETAISRIDEQTIRGNILDPSSQFPQGFPLKKLKTSENRLLLLGGFQKILRAMEERGVQTNIVLFTQMMLSVPAMGEELLLDEMDMAQVRPDITFYNLLVRKRAFRGDYDGAMRLVKLMEEHDLVPDIRTYGCLALTCRKPRQAYELLEHMEAACMQPNVEIMTSLMNMSNFNLKIKIHILRTMEQMGIQPERRFLDRVERKISFLRKWLAEKEKDPKPDFDYKIFGTRLQNFVDYYDAWTKRMELAQEEHPWAPFMGKKEETTSP